MAVKVDNHASLEDALALFTKECQPTLKEAALHKYFIPDRGKHHHSKGRSGKNRKKK